MLCNSSHPIFEKVGANFKSEAAKDIASFYCKNGHR
jgi:hypothetical protein